MRAGIASLMFGYVLSQFFRAFLAVLAPLLESELGASKQDLASASGYWFLAFGAMQLPVGMALDRIGPRRTAAACLMVGALGAAVFAMATTPFAIKAAMVLIGIGCAPVLMASFFIFAREFSPAVFATLAAITIGVGNIGNIASSVPLSAAVEAFGWRETVWGLAVITLLTGVAAFLLVRDPTPVPQGQGGSVLQLLKMPALWPILTIMVVCYAPPGALRGLWLGPYYADVWGYSQAEIGMAGLWMGVAMVIGSVAIGPMDRWFGTRKWVIFGGNLGMLICLSGLFLLPAHSPMTSLLFFMGLGLCGSTFPIVIAHARAFFPAHMVGRGVTLVNLFGIASVGVAQEVTGRLHAAREGALDPSVPYVAVFGFFAVAVALGLIVYLFAQDRTD